MIDRQRWHSLTFYQQLGNIASELSRGIKFKNQNDLEQMNSSLWRLLELLDLTIDDKKNTSRLRELCRFKEVLGDWYCQTKVYDVNPESLKTYALNFAMLAARYPSFQKFCNIQKSVNFREARDNTAFL